MDRLELKAREEGRPSKIVGHAAVFDSVAGPAWFREKIAPGAFAQSIKDDDVRALLNHDPNMILGRTRAGTLSLREDDKGLYMEIDPPDTQLGRDLMVSIGRGDISHASFAFQTVEEEIEDTDDGEVRIIKRAKLYDVSPVTYPFYEVTDVSLRGMEAVRLRKEKAEKDQAQKHKIANRRRRLKLQHRQ